MAKISFAHILQFILLCFFSTARLSSQQLQRVDYLPGDVYEVCVQTISDNQGGYYALSYFSDSVDIDPGLQTLELHAIGSGLFVARYSATGQLISYLPFLDGNGGPSYISIDNAGNLFVVGSFQGSIFLDSAQNYTLNSASTNATSDIFFAKYNSSLDLIWAKTLASTSGNPIYNYCQRFLISGDSLVITGDFNSSIDFDPSAAQFLLSTSGYTDHEIYIAVYDTSGSFRNAFRLPSNGQYYRLCKITKDDSGNIYFSGYFEGDVDFDPGPGFHQLSGGGSNDGNTFLAKYSSTLQYQWAFMIGTTTTSQDVYDMIVKNGKIYICGSNPNGADFDPGAGLVTITGGSSFIARYDTSGSYDWAFPIRQVSMAGSSSVLAMEWMDSTLLVGGGFSGTVDLDPSAGNNSLSSIQYDQTAFVAIYGIDGTFYRGWGFQNTPNAVSQIRDITVESPNVFYLDITFQGQIDADITSLTSNVTSIPNSSTNYANDICITKYALLDVSVPSLENQSEQIVLSPVPTFDNILVSSGSIQLVQIEIHDLQGRIIYFSKERTIDNNFSINLSHFANGNYFFSCLTADGYTLTKPFVICHTTY